MCSLVNVSRGRFNKQRYYSLNNINHEGNMSDLELPNYVHEKVNVIEIKNMEVIRGLKWMKTAGTK